MNTNLLNGMATQLVKLGYEKTEAKEIAIEVYEDLDLALFDAHGEDEEELNGDWVKDIVDTHLGGDMSEMGRLIILHHTGEDEEAIADAGVPHQFYDHILAMV